MTPEAQPTTTDIPTATPVTPPTATKTPSATATPVPTKPAIVIYWDYALAGIDETNVGDSHEYVQVNGAGASNTWAVQEMQKRGRFSGKLIPVFYRPNLIMALI